MKRYLACVVCIATFIQTGCGAEYGLEVDAGKGLRGFAEIGDPMGCVIKFAKEHFNNTEIHAEESNIQTLVLPHEGIVVFGNDQGRVGAVDCFLKPQWTNFNSFKGIVESKLRVGVVPVFFDSVVDTFGALSVVELKGCLRYQQKGEDFSTVTPLGERVLWYSNRGIIFSFDSSNVLWKLRIEPPIRLDSLRSPISDQIAHKPRVSTSNSVDDVKDSK